tara:strand:- start:1291 stop:2628 length:1338 start_codon:yes stop_codon:yes gene_type:complete
MSHHDDRIRFVKPIKTSFENGIASLPVKGQGVVIFSPESSFTQLDILAPNRKEKKDTFQYFSLRIDANSYSFYASKKGGWAADSDQLFSCNKGYNEYPEGLFWLSIDFENRLLKGGYGEPRAELVLFSYQFEKEELSEKNIGPNLHPTKYNDPNDSPYQWLKDLRNVYLSESANLIAVFKDPIVEAAAMKVKSMDDISMGEVAKQVATVPANLPTVCQKLYQNVGGSNFNLANVNKDFDLPADFDLAKAIQYSIDTEGKICNEIIKKKADEFGDHPDMVYLRITMGGNQGESPGIPYVMEIWPSGKRSPIHNHGGSEAIIKVLHGEIQVKLFATLSKAIPNSSNDLLAIESAYEPHLFKTASFGLNDVTYITPWLNQIHQLENTHKTDACITIQCYGYPEDSDIHYEYFDWLNQDDDEIDHFFPDSDFNFSEFVLKMYQEYSERD